MAINLNEHKTLCLSAQERYDIIDFATQAAEDNGFMNSFIFERALWLFAAIRLCEDRRSEITTLVADDLLNAWDTLLADGTIEDMVANFERELDVLAEEGRIWLEEYTAYAHSARGLLSTLQQFSGDIVRNAAQQFQNMQANGDLQQVFDIASNWGMNNGQIDVSESLFTE